MYQNWSRGPGFPLSGGGVARQRRDRMNRQFRLLASLFLLLVLAFEPALTPASAAAGTAAAPAKANSNAPTPGIQAAEKLSEITGIAISPLLGVGAVGAYRYMHAPEKEKANLSWYAQPWFWIPALLLVGVCMAKDTLGTVLPTSLKKPLDVLELFENKASGLVATGAVVPMAMEVFKTVHPDGASLMPEGSSAMFAALDFSWLGNILMVPLALLVYASVWVVSHTIHVLILVSPFSTVDVALKSFRAAMLATVVGSHWLSPNLGALWAGLIAIVCIFLAGWAFRLAVFGHVFAWDLLTFRHRRFTPDARENWAFTGSGLGSLSVRTYGRLSRKEGSGLVFKYRPFLVLNERSVTVPAGTHEIGRGLIHPELLRVDGESSTCVINFPPRYKGGESVLAEACGASGVRDVGLRAAVSWIKSALGFGPATA